MADKENMEDGDLGTTKSESSGSRSILKSNTHYNVDSQLGKVKPSSLGGLQIPLKEDTQNTSRGPKLARRRVSFAPEVTLHKIDFVPQYRSDSFESDEVAGHKRRRETIAFMPSSSSGSEPGSEPVTGGDDGIGAELLTDSSDDEIESGGEEEDSAPIQSEIPITVMYDDSGEETMELTGPVGSVETVEKEMPAKAPIIESEEEEEEEEEMELTANIGQSLMNEKIDKVEEAQTNQIVDEGSEDEQIENEELMEFTEEVGRIQISGVGLQEKENVEEKEKVSQEEVSQEKESQEEESQMEFTQPIGSIGRINQNEELSEGSQGSQMEFTQPVGRIHEEVTQENNAHSSNSIKETATQSQDEDVEESQMEFTQPIGRIHPIVMKQSFEMSIKQSFEVKYGTEEKVEPSKELSLEENEEIEEMDMTQHNGKIEETGGKEDKRNDQDIKDDGKMEETQNNGKIDLVDQDESSDMELTQYDGRIDNKIDGQESAEQDSAEQDSAEPDISDIPAAAATAAEGNAALSPSNDDTSVDGPTTGISSSDEIAPVNGNAAPTSPIVATTSPVSNKRKSDSSSFSQSKLARIETTTIPLADVTNESFELEFDTEPVTLAQFMNDIGIRFYDDLEIDSKTSNRISISLPKAGETTKFSLREYVQGVLKTPQFKLGDFSCNELMQNIKEGSKIFDIYNGNTSEMNPRVFKEFYNASPEAQLNMKTKFQLVKDYARQEAKGVWYQWRIQLLQNLVDELKKIPPILMQDKLKIVKALEQVNEVFGFVQMKYLTLKEKKSQYVKLVQQGKELQESELLKFKTEFIQIKEHIEQFQRESAEQEANLTRLNETLLANEQLIKNLNLQIKEKEEILTNSKRYERSEINLLLFKFKLLQHGSNCKYISIDGSVLKFLYDKQVEISIDFQKEDIQYIFKESGQSHFKNKDLYRAFTHNLLDLIDINPKNWMDHFNEFKKLWRNLLELDQCVYRISLKFPIRIDNKDIIVKFYKEQLDCKLELRIGITMAAKSFESNLTINSLRMERPIDTQIVLGVLKKECKKNLLIEGLVNASWNEEIV
ncbi:hypothetical protein CAAN1_22S01882 [[Candida] anglica]|uniref:Spc7 kinetochore protein domain-containing protein n=1 Tax=[Candida] anglica TaxID=148631 RepID=A0ABP0E9E4_9ASCO